MASFFGFARGQFPDAVVARGQTRLDAPALRSARDLATLVEAEIIPRIVASSPVPADLVSANVAPANVMPADVMDVVEHDPVVSAADLDEFVPMTVALEADVLMAHIDRLIARGVSDEALLVDLLAPTARALGIMWETDQCDFLEVTMGVWRLQEIIHELASRRALTHRSHGPARRILLTTMPGDQHGFALILIEHLFELGGWETDRLTGEDGPEIVRLVAQDWYDVVGLTVSSDAHTAALPSLIGALRSVSKNPRLRVLVGGLAFETDPTLPLRVGADGSAANARDAVALAGTLVAETLVEAENRRAGSRGR